MLWMSRIYAFVSNDRIFPRGDNYIAIFHLHFRKAYDIHFSARKKFGPNLNTTEFLRFTVSKTYELSGIYHLTQRRILLNEGIVQFS